MNPAFLLALTALASMIGTGIGVYVGMKVGLARLETWREIAAGEIKEIRRDVNVLQDDSLIYDGEIDILYNNEGIHRAIRPRERMQHR